MDNLKSIKKTSLKYGSVGGASIAVFLSAIYFIDKQMLVSPSITMLIVLVIVLFLVFAIVEYRSVYVEVRFWKNMSIGIVIALAISICASLVIMAFVTVEDKALLNEYVTYRTEILEKNRQVITEQFGAESYSLAMKELNSTKSSDIFLDVLFKSSGVGLFCGILISAIFHFIYNKKIFTKP